MEGFDFFNKQKNYFFQGKTRSVDKRIEVLEKLDTSISKNEKNIFEALKKDLNKSNFESYLTEIAILKSEIRLIKKKLKKWSKPKRVKSTLASFPSKDYLLQEPYGITLIISPWNYPFQLALLPLISSISAGNTVVIKPSEHSPHTSKLIKDIISSIFSEDYVKVVLGDSNVATKLLKLRWDYIFFTGSVKVGKIVAKAASEFLTPLTLELGGKNPCIVDKNTNIKLTAKRLVWGKFVNAGQTCIAPDYLIVEKSIKDNLIDELIIEIERAYGKNQENSEDYARIINQENLKRLVSMINNQEIIYGGNHNLDNKYLSPTIINNPDLRSKLMKEEIFGPILPVFEYENKEDIFKLIYNYEKPLALYVFSKNSKFSNEIINKVSFGGGVINDTMIQFGNHRLPFGGVGESGMGSYHGESGYKLFSHQKPIVKKGNWLDISTRYAPYTGKLNSLKKLLRFLN
ncbi:aldehyde dehydrogenase [Flavobacteriaceae bacterium]|nr:aldehyde dehydrogenase [Flavobacteriaceae bacterium]MDC1491957.1 aldehyde dehydrogenase [Flavobacteriaceae bacterium]